MKSFRFVHKKILISSPNIFSLKMVVSSIISRLFVAQSMRLKSFTCCFFSFSARSDTLVSNCESVHCTSITICVKSWFDFSKKNSCQIFNVVYNLDLFFGRIIIHIFHQIATKFALCNFL